MIEFYNSRRRELTAEHSSLPDIEIYSDLNSRSAMLSSACLNTSVAVPEEREREREMPDSGAKFCSGATVRVGKTASWP